MKIIAIITATRKAQKQRVYTIFARGNAPSLPLGRHKIQHEKQTFDMHCSLFGFTTVGCSLRHSHSSLPQLNNIITRMIRKQKRTQEDVFSATVGQAAAVSSAIKVATNATHP